MNTTTLRTLRPFLSHPHASPPFLLNNHLLHQRCYPSSKQITKSFSVSSQRRELNAPPTTLPPPLELPTRAPEDSSFKFFIKRGKAYFAFYKTGLRAVFTNFSASMPIQKALDEKYGLQKESFSNAVNAGFLDRSQFQLLMRSWHDIWKIPLFAVVFLVCGEWTPVIVLVVPSVVPLTCRIPKQVEKERTKLEERRRKSFEESKMEDTPALMTNYSELNRTQLLHINYSLGLSSSLWDYVGGVPGVLLNRRVRRKMEYLGQDDMLIEKEGGADAIAEDKMGIEEVKLALVERGIDVLGLDDEKLRNALEGWFRARKESSIERLVLTRQISDQKYLSTSETEKDTITPPNEHLQREEK